MSKYPLDLNNLPMDFSRDHDRQPLDLSFTPAAAAGAGGDIGRDSRKKKQNGVVVKQDGSGKKVYKCRFCSLTFLKSQSLGGHMNRHRQEREEEALKMARQLVFGTEDNFYQPGNQPMIHGGYEHHQASGYNMGSASHPTTLFFGSSTFTVAPHPHLTSLGIPSYSYVTSHGYSAGSPQFIHINRITTPLSNDPHNHTCNIGVPVEQAFAMNGESGGDSSRHANAN